MKMFKNDDDAISFIKKVNATRVAMCVNDKRGKDGWVIGCLGVIGTIYTDDGDVDFQIGAHNCDVGRDTANRWIKNIRAVI